METTAGGAVQRSVVLAAVGGYFIFDGPLDVLAGPWAAVEEGPGHRACYPGARWFDLFQINRRRSRSFEAGNSVVPLGKAASGRAPRLRSRRKNDVAGRAVHCPPLRNLFFYACCRGAAKDAIQRKREANA